MQGKSTTVNLLVKRESRKKPLCFAMHSRCGRRRDNFGSSVFLEAGHSGKIGKMKKDTNPRVAGRRKEIKKRAAKQLCMDNISTGLNESNDSLISDSSESLSTSLLLLSSFRIFTEPFFSLTSIFSRLTR